MSAPSQPNVDGIYLHHPAEATRVILVDETGSTSGGVGVVVTVSGEVEVKNDTGNPLAVTFPPGTEIALDAATLAALEAISVIVTALPAVALDASTLAALETINAVVSGTVELGATTLAALETINANCTQSGTWTVALDALTLATLETINAVVTGTVSISGSVAVTGPLTDAQLRATPVPVSGTVTITDGSGPVTVDGTVGISGTVPVSGPLTDVQLRATPVPVSGTVTITDGSGPVTVDGTVAVSNFPATQNVAITSAVEIEVKNDTGAGLTVRELNQLVPFQYDYISLGYTGDDITTVVYKTGGAGGTTVATLTLAYSVPGTLSSVTRS